MKKSFCVIFCLVAMFALVETAMAQDQEVSVTFGKNMNLADARKVMLITADNNEKEILPESDGITYKVTKNANLRFHVTPRENFVVYVWEVTKNDSREEIYQSYSSVEQTLQADQDMEVFADICELVPVKFIVPEEGTTGKEVLVEEQGDFGRLIAPLEDGETYLLPKDRGAYFDPMIADGYNILSWNFGEEGSRFPSRPDQFYKQNISKDFTLYVRFYKDGETRTVTFTQPKTAVLIAKNHSLTDSPKIESESQVEPGDLIIFEIAPFDNPNGKVDLHHWTINGKVYMSDGDYYTDNSLSLFADEDLTITVVPTAEYEEVNIDTPISSESLYCIYHLESQKILVNTNQKGMVKLYSINGQNITEMEPMNGEVELSTSNLNPGIYLIQQNHKIVKVCIQ